MIAQDISIDKIQQTYTDMLNNGWSLQNIEAKYVEGKGIGIFAKKDFEQSEIIEIAHCIELNKRTKTINDKSIFRYSVALNNCKCDFCKENGYKLFIPLGFGNIYNTNRTQEENNAGAILTNNKYFKNNFSCNFFAVYFATKDIFAGDEIMVYYSEDYYDKWITDYHNQINKVNQI